MKKRVYVTTNNWREMLKTTMEELSGYQIDGKSWDSWKYYLWNLTK